MNYEELKQEISSRPKPQLPGLLLHVARLCGIQKVFKDKQAALDCVGKYYDMGPAGLPEMRGETNSESAFEKACEDEWK